MCCFVRVVFCAFKKILIHQFNEHPLGMFVDLCYVANVSVFIFDDEYRCGSARDAPLAVGPSELAMRVVCGFL